MALITVNLWTRFENYVVFITSSSSSANNSSDQLPANYRKRVLTPDMEQTRQIFAILLLCPSFQT